MKRVLIFCLLIFSFVLANQPAKTIVVLPIEGDINKNDKERLTTRMNKIALNSLPREAFTILSEDEFINRFDDIEEYNNVCDENSCKRLIEKGKVDYGVKCLVYNLPGGLRIIVQLYSKSKGGILDIIEKENANSVDELLSFLDVEAPDMFKKILPIGSKTKLSPTIQSGTSFAESSIYEFEDEQTYIVNLNTDPQGAVPSFDGEPIFSCSKTPCRIELPEGYIKILAALEQYDKKDTIVSVKENNQNINIKLNPNFGVLKINPAYKDDIGDNKQWGLTINNKAHSSFENRLPPGNYDVKLSHECYEDVIFSTGINKGGNEIINIAEHINLKKGGLVLRAERDDEPISEPVFENGKKIGETPFSGIVSLCSEISIGNSKKRIDIELKHNNKAFGTITFEGKKNYISMLNTDPQGAVLNFDGKLGCSRTPCEVELPKGNVKISAWLDQYEEKDTIVLINENYQDINIKLNPNFGELEIKPAYKNGIGDNKRWDLTIDNKLYYSFDHKLSPGIHEVRLKHECYEDIFSKISINKGSSGILYMDNYIQLKKGGLLLKAERDGKSIIGEPVFENGKKIGETPFNGTVFLCSEISIGNSQEKINFALKHNDKVEYIHKTTTPKQESQITSQRNYPQLIKEREDRKIESNNKKSGFWYAFALDLAGAAVIYYGYTKNEDMLEMHDKYSALKIDPPSPEYNEAWDKVEKAKMERNAAYIVGGILLSLGIGVHIWF